MFPKEKRELDPEYVRFIHEWLCIVPGCGRPWPVHAHHAKTRKSGGSDYSCLPLCPYHHSQVHNKGVRTFQAIHKINFADQIRLFKKRWLDGERGSLEVMRLPRSNFKAT